MQGGQEVTASHQGSAPLCQGMGRGGKWRGACNLKPRDQILSIDKIESMSQSQPCGVNELRSLIFQFLPFDGVSFLNHII